MIVKPAIPRSMEFFMRETPDDIDGAIFLLLHMVRGFLGEEQRC